MSQRETPQRSASLRRIPSLDGLRAISIALVIGLRGRVLLVRRSTDEVLQGAVLRSLPALICLGVLAAAEIVPFQINVHLLTLRNGPNRRLELCQAPGQSIAVQRALAGGGRQLSVTRP